jgi:proton-translocating NADH-quinone oxidoreductase chain N
MLTPLQATETIPSPHWLGLAPTLVLAAAALALLTYDMVDPDSTDRPVLAGIAGVGAVVALGAAAYYLVVTDAGVALFDGQMVADGAYWFFSMVFTSVTVLVVLGSYDYLADHAYQAEYYTLVLLAATGMTLMASANSLATVFVSLELASLPSYALVAFLKKDKGSVEAGLKYFLIGALSSAIFAYGISLVYGATGHLQLDAVASAVAGNSLPGVLGLGILMVAGGFAFKTASVPFHFWAPEAYEGAPAPISGFLSSASKAAGFAVAFRVFTTGFPLEALVSIGAIDWAVLFQVLAVVTMIVGNFAAAVQEKVKRMLAYSSVGHAGYALIGLAALTGDLPAIVLGAAMMHLLVYGFMNTGAFLFISLGEYWDVGRRFEDYNGLSETAPMAAVAMSVFMFSLAGLPPFGGFFSKYFLFMGAARGGLWWLAGVGAITSALSLYYYTKMVKAMWVEPADDGGHELRGQPRGLYAAVMVAALVTVLLLPLFGFGIESAYAAAEALTAAA